jgi:hypothetical protein
MFPSSIVEAREPKLLNEIRAQFTGDHWRKCGALVTEVLETIQSSPTARRAFDELIRAGCNPAVVLHEIGFYCGIEEEPRKKQVKYARKQLKTVAARLKNDARTLEWIVHEFMDESADQYGEAAHTPVGLRQAADSLNASLATLTAHTHGKTGTTKHLVYLSYHIKAATKRRYYKEIAQLIACVRGEVPGNLIQRADAIRNEFRSHEKQHPRLFREEKIAIELNLRAWREWQSEQTTGC